MNQFFELVDTEHAHAAGIVTTLVKTLKEQLGDKWTDKLVALGSDGASVNVGTRNSVYTIHGESASDYTGKNVCSGMYVLNTCKNSMVMVGLAADNNCMFNSISNQMNPINHHEVRLKVRNYILNNRILFFN